MLNMKHWVSVVVCAALAGCGGGDDGGTGTAASSSSGGGSTAIDGSTTAIDPTTGAPPVEANLVNYLWPLLMVVLAPVLLPGVVLRGVHVVAALLGFAGAALAIMGAPVAAGSSGASSGTVIASGWAWGYVPALGSAFIWASYSLWCQRVRPFPTSAIGLFALVSGVLALVCHAALEPAVGLSVRDWGLLLVMGLGPLGAAFFLWDRALKGGDARHIGILSYLTPLASTALLMVVSGRAFSWSIGLAAVMIIGAAVLGSRARAQKITPD